MEADMKAARTEFQERVDRVTAELDTKWQETLRYGIKKFKVGFKEISFFNSDV